MSPLTARVALCALVAAVPLISGAAATAERCERLEPEVRTDGIPFHVDPVIIRNADKLDLNTATAEKLAGLPYFEHAADRTELVADIIRHRPYLSISDMEERTLIPCEVVFSIWPWVTVRE